MLCCTLYIPVLIIIEALSILMAHDHPLLPKLHQCGQLNSMEFQDHSGRVQPNEFPWLAQIAYIEPKSLVTFYACTAVLINQRYLLAVAQCLENPKYEAYAVLLGRSEASLEVAIEEIVIHPYFNFREKSNDIALLRLNETIGFPNNIRPICLPGSNIKYKEFGGAQLIVGGWYLTGLLGSIHKLPVVVINRLDCHRILSEIMNITDSHMCGITCIGEDPYSTGSPLMDTIKNTNYYLAGLLSTRFKNCTYPQQPNVFTRVDRYMDWIENNLYP